MVKQSARVIGDTNKTADFWLSALNFLPRSPVSRNPFETIVAVNGLLANRARFLYEQWGRTEVFIGITTALFAFALHTERVTEFGNAHGSTELARLDIRN